MSFFSAQNISAAYGKKKILQDISFAVENGCMMGVLGANGSGKTTLLKAICGILPHEGSCRVNDTQLEKCTVRQLAKLCSYIPQRSGIYIDMPVLDVVLMGFNPRLGILQYPDGDMKRSALAALEKTGLSGREYENYQNLSEGQKQLCILARTIVSGSRLLLLDEPESALDFHFRYQMLELLRRWVSDTCGGAIVTLHDPALALNYCDQLMLLADGKILDILAPRTDAPAKMERQLSRIYGPVSLQVCKNRSGSTVLTMLKEDVP